MKLYIRVKQIFGGYQFEDLRTVGHWLRAAPQEGRGWLRLVWGEAAPFQLSSEFLPKPPPPLPSPGRGRERDEEARACPQRLELGAFGKGQVWLNPALLSWGQLLPFTPWLSLPISLLSAGLVGVGMSRESGLAQAWDTFLVPESLAVSCVVSAICAGLGWGVGVWSWGRC